MTKDELQVAYDQLLADYATKEAELATANDALTAKEAELAAANAVNEAQATEIDELKASLNIANTAEGVIGTVNGYGVEVILPKVRIRGVNKEVCLYDVVDDKKVINEEGVLLYLSVSTASSPAIKIHSIPEDTTVEDPPEE